MNLSLARLEHAVGRRIPHTPQVEATSAVLAMALTIAIALAAFWMHLNLASAISILLLATVIASIQWGVVQGTAVSLAAVGCLDFLFTPPLFKFSVHSPENWIALATFEATALLVSRLSWKERLHSEEQEYQRKGISKLYQLSNAILLVDSRSFDLEQLAALMREFFAIASVELWTTDIGPSSPNPASPGINPAYAVFRSGQDQDNLEEGWSHRVLRMGTSAIGGMVLHGWEVDPALASAASSLIAIAVERARSAQKENRAEAARNTEQLRTAVLDALAHGFKTPLTAIQTASSGLLAIAQLSPAETELVEIIDHEVSLLANLTTRLLRTAALDAREIRVRSSEVALVPLLEAILQDQDADTRKRVHIIRPASLQPIKADPQLLSLALAQLIDNAQKYSRVGSAIELTLREEGATTAIAVTNQSEPIGADELSRIFERYYRGPQAGRGPTGTGLGLSIVKKIAEAHGGTASASYEGSSIQISIHLPRNPSSKDHFEGR